MNLSEKLFFYCERGQDPAFWAEPLNAVSNAAFLIAALVAAALYLAEPAGRRSIAAAFLIALTFVIGIGSFLFHTYATRWASLADTIPIALFMLAYVAFALRRFLGFNWVLVAIGLAAFFVSFRYAGSVQCDYGKLLPITALRGARCMNGTVAYAPAFVALIGTGFALVALRHPAGRLLVLASGVFLVSMTFRTLDIEWCDLTRIAHRVCGTHFLWHILNGLTLYILLRAAIRHGAPRQLTGESGAPEPSAS
ncbi:ceramidase domain-containing protein [Hyphomicrobium sp. CS1GBMeth3]|uniref:ceramidase domain-containing protein n=1 Tax=Hyphomicrobium sp. CS1GBMeth3 TaxID=1892845 RepID=UPI00093091FE|nr:ceramidase domain-containing protein [Hyphomicrobium sp. CS1GBMeth3]